MQFEDWQLVTSPEVGGVGREGLPLHSGGCELGVQKNSQLARASVLNVFLRKLCCFLVSWYVTRRPDGVSLDKQ